MILLLGLLLNILIRSLSKASHIALATTSLFRLRRKRTPLSVLRCRCVRLLFQMYINPGRDSKLIWSPAAYDDPHDIVLFITRDNPAVVKTKPQKKGFGAERKAPTTFVYHFFLLLFAKTPGPFAFFAFCCDLVVRHLSLAAPQLSKQSLTRNYKLS